MRTAAQHGQLMLSQGPRTHLISPRPDHQHPNPPLQHAQENGPVAIFIWGLIQHNLRPTGLVPPAMDEFQSLSRQSSAFPQTIFAEGQSKQ